jgi:hypothetical protein
MDGKRAPLSGQFGRIWQNLWRGRVIAQKKTPNQKWSGVN